MEPRYFNETDCRPTAEILSRIGEKWSVMLVTTLFGGAMRFSELRRGLPGISQKVLTSSLRGLERDGFVERTIYPTSPPKVEYKLTPFGCEMALPVMALGQWAYDNRERVIRARENFDRISGHSPKEDIES